MTEYFDPKKVLTGLCAYIIELDSFRPPIHVLCINSFRMLFKSCFKKEKFSYFIRTNPVLHKKVQKELDSYYKKVVEVSVKELVILLVIWFFIIPVFSVEIIDIVETFWSVDEITVIIYGLLSAAIIVVVGFIPLILWRYRKHLAVAGEMYDNKLKELVEDLISYGELFISENELNPECYTLKLKFDDYHGLKYEKGNDFYFGYFQK